MNFFAILAAAFASLVSSDLEVSSSRTNVDVWKEGNVPYEIAKEFGTKHFLFALMLPTAKIKILKISYSLFWFLGDSESSLIKECMIELMKTTCVHFTPRFNNEVDYVVFMKYRHPTQNHGFDLFSNILS